jgi:hypothetical protein
MSDQTITSVSQTLSQPNLHHIPDMNGNMTKQSSMKSIESSMIALSMSLSSYLTQSKHPGLGDDDVNYHQRQVSDPRFELKNHL